MIKKSQGTVVSPPTFLDQKNTARLLGLSGRTLERFRLEGRGPDFRKFGSRVLYALSDVISWAESRKHSSTSECSESFVHAVANDEPTASDNEGASS